MGAVSVSPDDIDAAVRQAFPGAMHGECVEVSATHALVRRAVDATEARPGGYVSGPIQFGLVDRALWYLTFGVVDRIELMALTADIDISFLRPAHGEMLWARAELLSAGSRRIVGAVRVWCDDREDAPTAVAKGTYVVPSS